jgi:hypothetical protein
MLARDTMRVALSGAQVMRGIYCPNANRIYDVQKIDPGVPKKKSGENKARYVSIERRTA